MLFKQGTQKMYQFLNTPAPVFLLVVDCALPVGDQAYTGSAQTFGEDPYFPDVIHFYSNRNPKVTDPYRLFILEKIAFRYREVV